MGINTRRCPVEEKEDLCKDTPDTPLSVKEPGQDTHKCVSRDWCDAFHMNVEDDVRCVCDGELVNKHIEGLGPMM